MAATTMLNDDRLVEINDTIEALRASSRKTLPVFFLGILAAIVSAAVAIYYIVSLTADLKSAQSALRTSQEKLANAEASLEVASTALKKAQASSISPVSRQAISSAISDVSRTGSDIKSASASLKQAEEKLPAPQQSKAPEQRWFSVTASYRMNDKEFAMAQEDVAKIKAAGLCAELWKTEISRHYAVVLGGPADRATAMRNVGVARSSKIAPDAYVIVDRNWQRLLDSDICR
jgi:hypothetical protein